MTELSVPMRKQLRHLERLDDGIRCTHEEIVAVVELRGYRK